VLDASLEGFRIAHQEHLLEAAPAHTLSLEWDGVSLGIECQVEWTEAQPSSRSSRTLYHSELRIAETPGHSLNLLRNLIENHVRRALDEQRANARGIPALAAQSFQTGGGRQFIMYEKVAGTWRSTPTTDPRQPASGFTVSAALDVTEVAMLREAFDAAEEDHRGIIQDLARISIATVEGIPTRKYQP
jgi:hypothetical protein